MNRPTPRGRLHDIGGRRLHAVRAGPEDGERPLVVLEAGSFGFSADYGIVQDELAALGLASLAYDRAGLGCSDPGPAPRDGAAIVGDLEALLAVEAPHAPLILVGHSMAGLHVRHFAARNRERIVGLVLIDAATPESMDSRLVATAIDSFGGVARLAAWGAGAGLLGPLAGTGLGDRIGLGGATGEEKRWAFADAGHNRWAAEEVAQWPAAARQAMAAGALEPAWPVAVILAGPAEAHPPLKALQAAPAHASRAGSVEHVAAANHVSLLSRAHAGVIARAAERVLRAANQPAV
jgi:pimeloyl-ACP methyl ester carboxylesterase